MPSFRSRITFNNTFSGGFLIYNLGLSLVPGYEVSVNALGRMRWMREFGFVDYRVSDVEKFEK